MFTSLQTLILDKNNLTTLDDCPRLSTVKTLWCNNNFISDFSYFLDQVKESFPNVTKLSVMRNPASPPMICLSDEDFAALERHRLYVIYRLPQLNFLDSSPVTKHDRTEAKRRGQFLGVRKPKKKRHSVADGDMRDRSGSLCSVESNRSLPVHPGHNNRSDNDIWSAIDGGLASSASQPEGAIDTANRAGSFQSRGHSFSDELSDEGEHEEKTMRKPVAFLRMETARYDGKHSEGNRFIRDQDL